jgi:multidrug efflux pump subunit AcrA (membrane-fusion protein)
MPSFAGLISGVLGGTAKAYGEGAQVEMKKQSELDLRKQLLEAESEKRLREDEIKRGRDVAEEDRKMGPDYLAKVSAADLTKAQNAIANRKTLAPSAAEAGDVEFEAGKTLEGKKATAATTAKITEAGSLAGDAGYLTNVAKLATAAKDPEIKMNQARADALAGRSSGGGSSAVKVRSTYTDDSGQKIAVLSDGTTKVLGKAADYDKTLSNLVTKMAKDDYKFAKLPESEKRKQAEERLRGQIVVPSAGPKDLSKYELDKALNN